MKIFPDFLFFFLAARDSLIHWLAKWHEDFSRLPFFFLGARDSLIMIIVAIEGTDKSVLGAITKLGAEASYKHC